MILVVCNPGWFKFLTICIEHFFKPIMVMVFQFEPVGADILI